MFTTSSTLLDRLRGPGHPEAWERFILLYTPLLLVWARRQGFQEADAADLLQEVFLKLIHELPSYERKKPQSFRGWLFRVTVNQGRDFRRRKATRDMPVLGDLSEVVDPGPAPDLEEAEYRRLLVRRGLDLIRADFTETTWAAFRGVMLEGRPVADVAADLKMSPNAVYLARHRVLSRLRQELEGLLE